MCNQFFKKEQISSPLYLFEKGRDVLLRCALSTKTLVSPVLQKLATSFLLNCFVELPLALESSLAQGYVPFLGAAYILEVQPPCLSWGEPSSRVPGWIDWLRLLLQLNHSFASPLACSCLPYLLQLLVPRPLPGKHSTHSVCWGNRPLELGPGGRQSWVTCQRLAMKTSSPGVGARPSGTLAEIFTDGELGFRTWEESALMECSGV